MTTTQPTPLRAMHPETTEYEEVGTASVPAVYGDLATEYRTLRDKQGLLDLSACTLIEVRGDWESFLENVLARDVEYLTAERCLFSLVLDEHGAPVDVAVVYGRDDGVLIESSFGAGERLVTHLKAHAGDGVEVVERDDLVVIGLEGPYSWGAIGRLINQELPALPLEAVADAEWEGRQILFSRSGFTGEYGYKIISDHDTAAEFWRKASTLAPPVGQRALELAMLEIRQPVPHREFADGASVTTVGLNWLMDSTKENFVGRDAVMADFTAPPPMRTVGFSSDLLPEPGAAVLAGGEEIGTVVHAVHSVALGKTLGLARVQSEFAVAGLELALNGGTHGTAYTLASPYVIPKSWSVPIV
jgi:glycine cleavage system aminomethyltransferase T